MRKILEKNILNKSIYYTIVVFNFSLSYIFYYDNIIIHQTSLRKRYIKGVFSSHEV
jgi:hypothetical protein